MSEVTSALDPELAGRLAALAALRRSVLPEHIEAVREGARQLRPDDAMLRRDGAIAVTEHCAPSSDPGVEINILILRPADRAGRLPAVCFLHGGGMIAGDARTGLEAVLDWVTELGLCIVSIDYRLAPEHPHPAPVEDCYAALVWVDTRRGSLEFDSGPLLLAGASAGGGLAAGVALLARARGGPVIGDMILMAPMLDDRARLPSSIAFEADAPWDARSNRTGWSALLGGSAGGDGVPETAAPSRARDLCGLPATFIDVGAVETFRDEAIEFAGRLAAANVPTELHVWAGAFHGFDVIAADSAVALAARATRLEYLHRRLRGRARP